MPSSDVAAPTDSVARVALRLCIFCVPLALGWAGLEWGMARVPNSHSLKRAGLEALAPEIDTLIVGSSSGYFGLAPAHLAGSAFNLANVSQTLYYDEQLLMKVLPTLPRLERVIVPVGYLSLAFQLHDSAEDWRQYHYQHGWGIPPPRAEDRSDIRMWSLVALYSPSLALGSALGGFAVSLAPEVDARGWYRVPAADHLPDLGPAAARVVLDRHHAFMHLANEAANIASLDHMLGLLEQRGVATILVTMPVWSTYADGMDPRRWARTQATYERLARAHGARYLSFLREPRLTAEDFLDTDHLNQRGAVRFTQILDAALGHARP